MTLFHKVCFFGVVAAAAVFLAGCETSPNHDKMLSDNPTVNRSQDVSVNGGIGSTGTNRNVNQQMGGGSGVGTAGGM